MLCCAGAGAASKRRTAALYAFKSCYIKGMRLRRVKNAAFVVHCCSHVWDEVLNAEQFCTVSVVKRSPAYIHMQRTTADVADG